jgi:hypothetical protein
MKTVIKLIIAGILLSSTAFAKSRQLLVLTPKNRDSVSFQVLEDYKGIFIRVIKTQPDLTIITIYDSDRKIIRYEKYWKGLMTVKGYSFPDPGTYYLVVESGSQKVEKTVTVAIISHEAISLN